MPEKDSINEVLSVMTNVSLDYIIAEEKILNYTFRHGDVENLIYEGLLKLHRNLNHTLKKLVSYSKGNSSYIHKTIKAEYFNRLYELIKLNIETIMVNIQMYVFFEEDALENKFVNKCKRIITTVNKILKYLKGELNG